MHEKSMSYWDIAQCKKIAHLFKTAVERHQADICSFTYTFLKSEVAVQLIDFNEALISQGDLYILSFLPMEDVLKKERESSDVAEWMGYLIGYWCLKEDGKPELLAAKYDWKEVYYSYETLHTQSCSYAIEFVMENYMLAGEGHEML